MDLLIERLHDLPVDDLDGLLAESEQAGIRFVRRLVEEWGSGANRFDRPGEALFGARVGGQWVGVCGLNVDPYAAEERVGRVRHLYVLVAFRRLGVGRRLVAEVVGAARGRFDALRVRTMKPTAAQFYERLGFVPSGAAGNDTHVMMLASEPLNNSAQRTGGTGR
jgi:GNAT superfamily N-acetyltransferase